MTKDILKEFNNLIKLSHYNTDEAKLGLLGELLIQDIYGGELSEDLFDSSKDLVIKGVEVEVKTQARWKLRNAFTIPGTSHQINKCKSVQELYFVEPGKNFNIRIYKAPAVQKRNFKTVYDNYNNKKYIMPVESLDLIRTCSLKGVWNEMMKYSVTNLKYLI